MSGEINPRSRDAPVLLAARGIIKDFSAVRALDRVDFDLRAGEVHVLFGENGAGKSTLINVFAGAIQPDQGTIELAGRRITLRSPADARRLGIASVFQDFSLAPHLSVADNILLGVEPTRWGLLD